MLNAPREFPARASVALTLAVVTSPHEPWQRPDDAGGRPASARLVDPEDDLHLPAANYGHDAETTAIPRYDSAKSADPQPFALLGDAEPLPYVQPSTGLGAGAYGTTAAPAEVVVDEDHRDRDRRGTQDLGLLVLRVAVGVLFIAHGAQKMFGLWGGSGLGGFRDYLAGVGFQHADILSYVAAGGQIAAGLLLVLGLFTPLAAAGGTGIPGQRDPGRGGRRPQRRPAVVFPRRRPRVRGHPALRRRGHRVDRAGAVRTGRRPGLGPPTVHRVVRRVDPRCRRRRGDLGTAQRHQSVGVTTRHP